MWNSDALTTPQSSIPQASYRLLGEMAAIQLACTAEGTTQLGPISRLPTGALIEVVGAGFNEGTVKIRYDGSFYFVFSADLEANTRQIAVGEED